MAAALRQAQAAKAAPSFGAEPTPRWVPVSALRINRDYQRTIDGKRSQAVIAAIERNFCWAAFQSIQACGDGNGGFYVLDGQHRVEAARRLKIKRVPATVLPKMSTAAQARAFELANLNRVAMSAIHIFHARLARGDEEAVKVHGLARAAGLVVPPYPKASNILETGETMAVGTLERIAKAYPRAAALPALKAAAEGVSNKPGEATSDLLGAAVLALKDVEPERRNIVAGRIRGFLVRLKPFELAKMAAKRRIADRVSITQATADIIREVAEGGMVRRGAEPAEQPRTRQQATAAGIPNDVWALVSWAAKRGTKVRFRNQALTVFGVEGVRMTKAEFIGWAKARGWKPPPGSSS